MKFIAVVFGIAVFSLLLGRAYDQEYAVGAGATELSWRQSEILVMRARTHGCQRQLGRPVSPVAERIVVGGPAYRRWVLNLWRKRATFYCKAAADFRGKPDGIAAAWAWYARADTQCVVSHEGGWRSPSIDPPGVYAGRFQMDYSFERETVFGRRMSDRYGRAWNWPPWAQVFHAFEVWVEAGWSRWPTYERYCA